MSNRLSREKQIFALKMVCEGNSIRSTSRVLGIHKNTVSNLVNVFGMSSKNREGYRAKKNSETTLEICTFGPQLTNRQN